MARVRAVVGARRPPRRAPEPPRPAPELAVAHPAYLTAALIAAACVLFSVSYRIIDTDLWQHLAVGRAIWSLHGPPQGQIWNWPGYGEPYVTPSWGFRALVWPFWTTGGLWARAVKRLDTSGEATLRDVGGQTLCAGSKRNRGARPTPARPLAMYAFSNS